MVKVRPSPLRSSNKIMAISVFSFSFFPEKINTNFVLIDSYTNFKKNVFLLLHHIITRIMVCKNSKNITIIF